MKGNNSIMVCQTQMIEMAQHYFDSVMFAKGQAPKIECVKFVKDGYNEHFEIGTCEPEPDNSKAGPEL
jgi:hypothetical protein